MTKADKIDLFLKAWAQYGLKNPSFSFRDKQANEIIYHNLVLLGVPHKEKEKDIGPMFDSWKEFFKNYEGMTITGDSAKDYYCKISSKDESAKKSPEKIRIFTPLDGSHLERGAKEIFAFLANHNISHTSKVSRKIRLDDITIGLGREKDARALLEFIKKNPYLQEGLLEPNPFAFQSDGIALVCDGDYSFNGTVTALIQMYMNYKKGHNELETVSYEDFFDFLANCYTDEFIMEEDKPFERALGYEKDEKAKKNFQGIFSLIAKSQNPAYDLDDFMAHFRRSLNSKQGNALSEQLLIECVDAMSQYYHNSRKGIVNVESYVIDNEPRRLTNKNDLRSRVVNSTMREDVLEAMKKEKTTFRKYLKQLMEKYQYDPTQYDTGNQK